MDSQFWHQKWHSGEIGFHLSDVNPLLAKHFDKLSLAENSRIFLPLCGKTLDMAWLLSKNYRVIGVELHENAAKQFFDEMGVEVTVVQHEEFLCYSADNIAIYVGDFFDLSAQLVGSVDAIYDRAAIVALPEAMRKSYVAHLLAITNAASQLLINYQYDQTVMSGPPFSVSNDEVKSHYQAMYDMTLLEHLDVEGGLKGKYPATENVWLLQRT